MLNIDLSAIPPTTWISIVAAFAACISAILAARNSNIARQALAISAKTSKLANANASLYLIDAFRYREKQSTMVMYVFCVSIENKSTIQNSIVDAELKVTILKDEIERTGVFRHAAHLGKSNPLNIKNQMNIPSTLAPRGGLVANCFFEVPFGLLDHAEVGPFRLIIKYAEGSFSEAEHNLIMDVIDLEHLEQKRKTGVPI